jgi:hypothetical protein
MRTPFICRYLSGYAWAMKSLAAGLAHARDVSSTCPKKKEMLCVKTMVSYDPSWIVVDCPYRIPG